MSLSYFLRFLISLSSLCGNSSFCYFGKKGNVFVIGKISENQLMSLLTSMIVHGTLKSLPGWVKDSKCHKRSNYPPGYLNPKMCVVFLFAWQQWSWDGAWWCLTFIKLISSLVLFYYGNLTLIIPLSSLILLLVLTVVQVVHKTYWNWDLANLNAMVRSL